MVRGLVVLVFVRILWVQAVVWRLDEFVILDRGAWVLHLDVFGMLRVRAGEGDVGLMVDVLSDDGVETDFSGDNEVLRRDQGHLEGEFFMRAFLRYLLKTWT